MSKALGKRPAQPLVEATPEPSLKRARICEIADHLTDVVGVLIGKIDDELVRIAVYLNRVVFIGRGTGWYQLGVWELADDSDVRLDSAVISRIHLRITPVRTNTSATLVTVSDLSQCGFMLNGVYLRPNFDAKIGERRVRCKTFILKEHDRIGFLNCPVGGFSVDPSFQLIPVFTFYQGDTHKMVDPDEPSTQQWVPVFSDLSPHSTHELPHWTLNNVSLGAGSFGAVNLASHRDAPLLQVACKTVVKSSKDDDKKSLLNEVLILNKLNHHNINGIIDMIEEEVTNSAGEPVQRLHLILELMCGGDLFAYHDKHGRLSELEVKWIAWQMVNGLLYLHDSGIAHRDLKPENILLTVSAIYPRIVIGDFGHAVTLEEIIKWTPESDADSGSRPTSHVGTMNYVPPERLKQWLRPRGGLRGMVEDLPKKKRAGGGFLNRRETLAHEWFEEEARLDSWALGVTLYILATGLHPYEVDANSKQTSMVSTPLTPLASQSYKSMTPSQSWRSFRSIVGEGSRLGSTFLPSHEAVRLKSLYEACRVGRIETSQTSFLAQLLEVVPYKRLRMADAHIDKWFTQHIDGFRILEARVVKGGEVLDVEGAVAILGPAADPAFTGANPTQEEFSSLITSVEAPFEPGPSDWATKRKPAPTRPLLFFERDDSDSSDDDDVLPTVQEEDEGEW